jgi:hypothetical protein
MKLITSTCALLSVLLCFSANGQSPSHADLFNQIQELDSIMFSLVYNCDKEKIESFFTEDLEFYHDKGGMTKSRATFMENQQKNFCGERPFYLRREVVPGTMKVFPMNNYGAVQSGDHVFYIKNAEGKEVLDGKARYTNLWKFDDGKWRIARVISYDHGPAR